MCVRYSSYGIKDVIDHLGIDNCDELDHFKDNYNAAPGQYLPVVTCKTPKKISLYKWGLIPPWYKTGITASNMFNVEADQISKRPVLRSLLQKQRCLIITSGYYEWKIDALKRVPYRVKVKDEAFTLLAGLFEISIDKRTGERMDSFTVITTRASSHLTDLYPTMPLTLMGDYQQEWLSLDTPDARIKEILMHDATHEVEVYKVSDDVTDSRSNLASLIIKI